MKHSKFCPATWFSGFFALAALVHLGRSILGLQLVVGGYEIPLAVSVIAAFVFSALSIGCFVMSQWAPCCKDEERGAAHEDSGAAKKKGVCCFR